MPVLTPGPTTRGAQWNHLWHIISRVCVSGGTTEDMATAVMSEGVRKACSSKLKSISPYSSAVRRVSVETRHSWRRTVPSNAPMVTVVLPTSMASSTTQTSSGRAGR